MARPSLFTSWSEPLLPLTEKQLQAATESHDYAIAHELFLALETDDHLPYHYRVAADEQRRIPAAERSLAEDYLPPLVIPSSKIDELWTVPRRVAAVLEAACRWLDDDELKACEEAAVSRKVQLSGSRRPACLKLEMPLLCTDPDTECAELETITTAAVSCGEANVRQHGVLHDAREIEALFTIPTEAYNYSARLEEGLRTETLAVSEHVIRSLVSLMGSMEWTEKDRYVLLNEQLTIPNLPERYLSPPLPPAESFEYYIPEGEVCLVSDASDVSSGISEALEEAERLLFEDTNNVWKEDTEDFETASCIFASPVPPLQSVLTDLQERPRKHRLQESDISISISSSPSIITPQAVQNTAAEDDALFIEWIDQSVYDRDNTLSPQLESAYDGTKKRPGSKASGSPKRQNGLQDILSDDSCPDADFQDMTEEALLALEKNNTVAQAKLSVPNVGVESSLPAWFSVGKSSVEMFRWILLEEASSIVLHEWLHRRDKDSDLQLFEAQINAPAEECKDLAESLEFDAQLSERVMSWLATEPCNPSFLFSCIKPIPSFEKCRLASEKPLNYLDNRRKKPPEKAPTPAQQGTQSSRPKKDTKSTETKAQDPWCGLMARFKKRKTIQDISTQSQEGNEQTTTAFEQRVQIKAPELLLGFRAFADPRALTDNDRQRASRLEQKRTISEAASASTVILQNSLAVQPIDTRTTHIPKAVLSTAVPRAIRSTLLQLLPSLEFVERDYQQQYDRDSGINCNDEADLVISPSTGIIVTTMVGLRQTDLQRQLVFHARIATVAPKYRHLYLYVYRSHARPVNSGARAGALPELSPSDAMAVAQLQGFVQSLTCKVSASYVGGGEQTVVQWIARLILQKAEEGGKKPETDTYLVEEDTVEERFLRQAGFNVYDAQIVIGILQSLVGQHSSNGRDGRSCIRRLIEMTFDERVRLLNSRIGCPGVLTRVNQILTEHIQSGITER